MRGLWTKNSGLFHQHSKINDIKKGNRLVVFVRREVKMTLSDIYYYFIARAMMAGVQIADLFNLNIDQNPNGRISISFGASDFLSKLRKK